MKQFFNTFIAVLLAIALAAFSFYKYAERDKQAMINVAFLTQGIADSMPYRLLVAEHWQSEGTLACKQEQLGISSNQPIASQSLATVELSGCGQLTLNFNEQTGLAGGTVIWQAKLVDSAFGKELDWQCYSSDYPSIAKYVPQCRYNKADAPDSTSTNTQSVNTVTKPKSESTHIGKAASCANGADLYHTVFTDRLIGNVPADRLVAIGPTREQAYFFTEIIGASGRQVVHRWFHNDEKVVDVVFSVRGDRWPTWSSQLLGLLGNGLLRVDVFIDDCLIGQQSVLVADHELKSVVDNIKHGWMRPTQAMETVLAKQANETAADAEYRSAADALTESGDTPLIEALRNGNAQEALWLIQTPDREVLNELSKLQPSNYAKYLKHADPFLKGADGSTPLQLAKAKKLQLVVAALESSILKLHKRSRRNNSTGNSGRWGDSIIALTNDADTRFDNGDTPLHRAVRTNNERAVATMLGFGTVNPASSEYKPKANLYAYDRAGQQPLDIARTNGFTGVEHLLLIAQQYLTPEWAVARASFATKMSRKQPSECRKVAYEDEPSVYFFAELADLKGRDIVHEWSHNGVVQHQQKFHVSNALYPSISKREFTPAETGRWKVAVRLVDGRVLATRQLTYRKHDNTSAKNRTSYLGPTNCELGLGTLYALARAQAPLAQFDRLIEQGLTFNPRRSQFKDVFMIAHESGNISLVRWFLEQGFSIEREIVHRKSPMTVAAYNGKAPMMLFLLNQGAELSEQNGDKLLRYAARQNYVGVAKILLDRGVNPNQIGREGTVPLIEALEACNLNVAVLLLQSGANRQLLLSERNPDLPAKRSATLKERAGECIKHKSWSVDNPAVEYVLGLESLASH